MADAKRICTFTGCTRGLRSKGLCEAHYKQRLRGAPLTPIAHPFRSRWTLEETIARHSESRGDCLVWTGETEPTGYPHVRVDGRWVRLHRALWEERNGSIPPGMQIDHRCHVRACINVDHLQLATQKQQRENMAGAQRNNKSGIRGVYWRKDERKWEASVQHDKRRYYAGFFDDIADAERAVIAKRNELFTNNLVDRGENIASEA